MKEKKLKVKCELTPRERKTLIVIKCVQIFLFLACIIVSFAFPLSTNNAFSVLVDTKITSVYSVGLFDEEGLITISTQSGEYRMYDVMSCDLDYEKTTEPETRTAEEVRADMPNDYERYLNAYEWRLFVTDYVTEYINSIAAEEDKGDLTSDEAARRRSICIVGLVEISAFFEQDIEVINLSGINSFCYAVRDVFNNGTDGDELYKALNETAATYLVGNYEFTETTSRQVKTLIDYSDVYNAESLGVPLYLSGTEYNADGTVAKAAIPWQCEEDDNGDTVIRFYASEQNGETIVTFLWPMDILCGICILCLVIRLIPLLISNVDRRLIPVTIVDILNRILIVAYSGMPIFLWVLTFENVTIGGYNRIYGTLVRGRTWMIISNELLACIILMYISGSVFVADRMLHSKARKLSKNRNMPLT